MNRIMLERDEIDEEGIVALSDRRADHIRYVLKSDVGAQVRVGEVNGKRGMADILAVKDGVVTLRCRLDAPPLPCSGVSLLLAMPRPKVMGRLWAPLASLGLDSIIVVRALKVRRDYFDTHWLDSRVYRPLLVEGLAQSGETRLPSVEVVLRMAPFISDVMSQRYAKVRKVVCHPGAGRHFMQCVPTAKHPLLLAIGPEGGWADKEIDLFVSHGFECAHGGDRVLRSDVAALTILGAVFAWRHYANEETGTFRK